MVPNKQGSLRRQQAGPPLDPNEKQEIQTLIENNPKLKELVQGGPDFRPDALSELQTPPWVGQPAMRPAPTPTQPPPRPSNGSPKSPLPPPAPSGTPFWMSPAPQTHPEPHLSALLGPPVPLRHLSPSAAQSFQSQSDEGVPALEPQPAKSAPQVAPSPEKKEPFDPLKYFNEYQCHFYWENDPETFSAEAFLYGEVSDTCLVNQHTRVRFRSLTTGELSAIDGYVPRPTVGIAHAPDVLGHHRAVVRLAMSMTHINGTPLGDIQQKLSVIDRMPEVLTVVLSNAALEFQVRMTARVRGAQEQLKN